MEPANVPWAAIEAGRSKALRHRAASREQDFTESPSIIHIVVGTSLRLRDTKGRLEGNMPALRKMITAHTLPLWLGLLAVGIASAGWAQSTSAPARGTIILGAPVRDSINAIFLRFNEHWDELGQTNTLTQMLGTGHPTQHEYLGCL